MEGLARVVLPNEPRLQGKFIQVYLEGQPFFRSGDGDSLHGILFMKFLDEQGIHYKLIDDDIGNLSPVLKEENYELVGAGRIDSRGGEFVLYGSSKSYSKLPPNQKHLDDLAPHIPQGIKFTIQSEQHDR